MAIFFCIVLIVLGGFLTAYYAGQFCSNYGYTKREKTARVFQLVLLVIGALMFVVAVMAFPIFVF